MNEDLYNKIDRYNNGEMEAEEAANFRQELYNDEDLADEVRLNQRIDEEFSDAKKIALREALGEISDSYVPATPKRVSFRHWMPVIVSTAAAAVALYFFVSKPSFDSVIPGTEELLIPKSAYEYTGKEQLEQDQLKLGIRLAAADVHSYLDTILGKSSPNTINIYQPKDSSYVLAPSEDDTAYLIKGDISITDLEKFGMLRVKWFDAEKLLEQKSIVLSETEPSESSDRQSFSFNFNLPSEQSWRYYQIVSQNGEIVLYTGKLGVAIW